MFLFCLVFAPSLMQKQSELLTKNQIKGEKEFKSQEPLFRIKIVKQH